MMEQKQYELAAQVLREVQKVILGKREIVEKVLMAVLAQGHVLLDDVPGVGKTTLAMAFARALGLETRRVQFTPDTMVRWKRRGGPITGRCSMTICRGS